MIDEGVVSRAEREVIDVDDVAEGKTGGGGGRAPVHDRFCPTGKQCRCCNRTTSMDKIAAGQLHNQKPYRIC